jgi:hypothetical protein
MAKRIMILKLQKSLHSSDGVSRMLAYDKDKSYLHEQPMPGGAEILFHGRPKIFVRADVDIEANDIEVFELLPDQGW